MTEFIHLYTADGWTGEMIQGDACREGVLEWVPKERVEQLPIWEGDKIFFKLLNEEHPWFSLKLVYEGDTLRQAVLDGKLKPASAGDLTTSVGRAYNVTLKGTTPVAGADKSNYRLDFTGSRFYYCSIEACWKGIWPADPCYVKNTGFRYMNDMAVQVSGAAKKVYLENLAVVDANSGFESQLEGFYVKGFIDVFNYKSENDLKEFVASSSTREKLIQAANDTGILETSASGMQ